MGATQGQLKMKKPHWIQDLDFALAGLHERCQWITPFGEQCPIAWMLSWDDIQTLFRRLGLQTLLNEHLEDLKKIPWMGEETRMMRSFAYGFTVHNKHKRKYTIYALIWY